MAEKEIYLVRHLATSMNKSGVYMGRERNPPVLESEIPGFIKRVNIVKDRFDLTSPKFYSSPALRCVQTLDLVKDQLGLSDFPTKIENDLWETNFGNASGLTVQQIKEQYPDVYNAWITDQSKTIFPNGESYQDVQARGWKVLHEILTDSGDSSCIFMCTHVDVIKMILFKITGTPISNKPSIIVPNGGICTLVASKNSFKLKLE